MRWYMREVTSWGWYKMMTQYTFAACGQRNATEKYEHAPMIRARQVAQANTHLEDEELIEKNSAYRSLNQNWMSYGMITLSRNLLVSLKKSDTEYIKDILWLQHLWCCWGWMWNWLVVRSRKRCSNLMAFRADITKATSTPTFKHETRRENLAF